MALSIPEIPGVSPPRLLFVSATAANVRQGSGTYVGIATLQRALIALGCQVGLIAPAQAEAALWRRLWFHVGLAFHHSSHRRGGDTVPADADIVVGFDLDGPARPGHFEVRAIKGVLAEEAEFERGWARASLRLQARVEGRRARRADRVIATSHYAADAIARRYRVPGERIRIVPELIDLAAWDARFAAAPPPSAGTTILCVAHLYPRKDVHTLLQALALLAPPTQLHLVGIGPELPGLRRLAAELGIAARVQFLGHLPLARLAAEYRQAGIFCLPSRQEGFGIVLLEAMAAGLPIVAARAAAIPEVVGDGDAASLFPPGDADALAGELRRLLADPGTRARMGAAARLRVQRFDAARVAAEFLAAIAHGQETP